MAIPQFITDSFKDVPGFDPVTFTRVHEDGSQVSSVRVNPAKLKEPAALTFSLDERVPWASNGWYLVNRPFFTFDPLLHAGGFYVQEASSMFLEQALLQATEISRPLKVLDLCAAPGGKSTHIRSLLAPGSVLVSNEVIRSRAAILQENLVKWGDAGVVITNNDPRDFSNLDGLFDVIVVDAPCSGSGMFRRDPASQEEWSLDLVTLCSQRQQRIVADIWPALREGGILVYSTCSYSVEEDETIADWICNDLEVESVALQVPAEWRVVETVSNVHHAFGYRFYPDKIKGEGFYLAVFRKISSAGRIPKAGKPKWEPVSKKILPAVQQWLKYDDFSFITINDSILALPEEMEKFLQQLHPLYIKNAGISMGKWMGRELVPDHALALSTSLSENVATLELNYETALRFLRKEEIKPENVSLGWTLVHYRGHSLGWIKVLQNRTNNYYPKEWRILKQA